MEITKIVTTKQDIRITDVTLLTTEEAEALPVKMKAIGKWWWLRSPGRSQDFAAFVDYDGALYDYYSVNISDVGVRPALKIESTDLMVDDKFELAGQQWTVINEDTALCDNIVGKAHFRKDWKAPDANDYEASDIKKWLENWVIEKGIEIETPEFAKKTDEKEIEKKIKKEESNV